MALEVFWASGSPPSWRVLLTLLVKGVPFESKAISFSKGDNTTPEYLKINPRGKVPAIRDGSFTLYESLAIMAYLERKYPDVPIFGETPEEAGTIWRIVAEHEDYIYPTLFTFSRAVFHGKVAEKEEYIKEGAAMLRAELTRLQEALGDRPWFVGDRISAADIAMYPPLQFAIRAATRPAASGLNLGYTPLREHFPKIAEWCARIEALPGYDSTYPPHWRGT
jgi:glutathione S-transferase